MDNLLSEILWKMEEVKRLKKAKSFYEELSLLEDLQTKAIITLMKARLMIKIIANGETISKEKLTTYEIKYYKTNKLERIQEDFKKQISHLLMTTRTINDMYLKKVLKLNYLKIYYSRNL